MKWHNGYRAALGVFTLVGMLIGALIVGLATVNLDKYDPGGSLVWLSFGEMLFKFAALAGIAWLVVSALTLTGDQREEKTTAVGAAAHAADTAPMP
ncbi:MAG: hypothetical protein LH605_08725 [Microbacteriaceae bacterium]|nr:hypothetical protein [Microbacteriaceae bacterium]